MPVRVAFVGIDIGHIDSGDVVVENGSNEWIGWNDENESVSSQSGNDAVMVFGQNIGNDGIVANVPNAANPENSIQFTR